MIEDLILNALVVMAVGLAGYSEAVMDTLSFHYKRSKLKDDNSKFWNPSISWKNKYGVDGVTPKFPGSTTLFVFTTDAWHLFKFGRNLMLFIALPLIGHFNESILGIVIVAVICRVVFGISFTFFYGYYSNKK
jgi:hypothetical protein